MADTHTIIVGNREYTCLQMNAFAANRLLLRLQAIITPVIGALAGNGKSLGDVDVKDAAREISEHLTEATMDNIVLPMFAESKLYSIEHKRYLKTGTDIDMCFTVANLFDLYELIFELGRYQFGPFFQQVMDRFGVQLAAPAMTP